MSLAHRLLNVLRSVVLIAASCIIGDILPAANAEPSNAGVVSRQGRESSPAIVNPVIRSPQRETLSLDGSWDFCTDPKLEGETSGWYLPEKSLPSPRKINVPGCWEAQGVGEPGLSNMTKMKLSYESINVKLKHSYTGAAWYKKAFTIPTDWTGKQIWLKLGGVNAQGWIWINGAFVAHDWSYCGTWKYNVTNLVTPGQQATIAVLVRNDLPSRRGESNCVRPYGGLFRSVELDATSAISIDNVYAEPLLDEGKVRLHVTLRNTTGKAAVGTHVLKIQVATVSPSQPVGDASKAVMISADATTDAAIEIPLHSFRPWSPESPTLYRADVSLMESGRPIDGWSERFGVKKFEVRGGDLYLNNERYFLRGYGDDHMYSMTICSPASRAEHVKHLKIAKQYGFNYVRLHTHCEVPEFYEAADEVGMMVQPELPYFATAHMSCAAGVTPRQDLPELVSQYRRYTSLAVYCGGNEGERPDPQSVELRDLAHRLDASRPWVNLDGGKNSPKDSDINCYGYGVNYAPLTDNSWPHVKHEYLSQGLNEDPRLEPKYANSRLEPSRSLANVKNFVAHDVGLDWKWAESCFDAGYRLQGIWHKRGLEMTRLDPYLDGFGFFLLADLSPSTQCGILDIFWDKKWSTPEFFREFNSPTVITARRPKSQEVFDLQPGASIFSEGDQLTLEWMVSHFQPRAVENGILLWQIVAGEKTLTHGRIGGVNAPSGSVTSAGQSLMVMPHVARATKAKLMVELQTAQSHNSWDIWIFPKFSPQPNGGKGMAASAGVFDLLDQRYPGLVKLGTPEADGADVVVVQSLNDSGAAESLQRGKRVISLSLPQFNPLKSDYRLFSWAPGLSNQSGTAIAAHPAFGDFPNEGFLDQSWFRLVSNAQVEKLDKGHKFRDVEPLMVGIGRESNYSWGLLGYPLGFNLYAFQSRVGQGKLLATGLNLANGNPEAVYLLDQFIRYARSEKFAPQGTFDNTQHLQALHK